MSQKKVDQYKKDKKNRKKIIASEKKVNIFEKTVADLISVDLEAYIVIYAYYKWFDKSKDTTAEVATYSLSEKEVSSAWNAYEESTAETTVAETTAEETTVAETTTAEETTVSKDTKKDDKEDSEDDDSKEEDKDSKDTEEEAE